MTVAIRGFSGDNSACKCNSLNGTYTLHRGDGYAPTALVRVFANQGYGARILANLIFDSDSGTYTVGSVEIQAGGTGYTPDAYGEIVIQGGIVACADPPAFELELARVIPPQPPVIEFSILPPQSRGYGAEFEIVWSAENETEGSETWSVADLNVLDGGRNYLDRSSLFIRRRPGYFEILPDPGNPGESLNFRGTIVIDHAVPVLEQVLVEGAGGGGAEFSYSWVLNQTILDDIGETELDYRYWQLANLTVTNGGAGYALGDRISYRLANVPSLFRDRDAHDTYGGTEESPFVWGQVTGVDENGTITQIETTRAVLPSHSRTDGIIQRVIVDEAGEYYGYGGIKSVTILNGGTIWPSTSCNYSACFEIPCGENIICRRIWASIGPAGGTLSIADNYGSVLTATFAADDERGPCISGGSSSVNNITLMSLSGDCSPGTITVSQGGGGQPDRLACCWPGGGGDMCPVSSLLWVESPNSCGIPFECPNPPSGNTGLITSYCGFGDAGGVLIGRGGLGFPPGGLPNEWQSNTTYHSLRHGFGFGAYFNFFKQEQTGQVIPFAGPLLFTSEQVQFFVGYVGRRWKLYGAGVGLFSGITDFDTVWAGGFVNQFITQNIRGGDRSYAGFTDTTPRFPEPTDNGYATVERDFCIRGSGDSIELVVRKDGFTFGGVQFSFAINGFVVEQVRDEFVVPPPLKNFQSMTFVIREWTCENPLP
jgi:hypothetical protein